MKEKSQELEKVNKFDLQWTLALFGTAVGAGILFLPIRAGSGGFFPLLLMSILVFPMAYLSHKALAMFVMSSANKEDNITNVIEENFGNVIGNIITLLYFFALYPICLVYGVGITNTVSSFLVNQLGFAEFPRWLLAFSLISLMMFVMVRGKHFMLKVTAWMVYPLIICLLLFSLYLIPSWNLSSISTSEAPSFKDFIIVIWATIPVLVFAFSHFAAISSFSVDARYYYDESEIAEKKASKILLKTSIMLAGFIMFFVFSFVLTLSNQQLLEAREQNISVLSYIANLHTGNVFLLYFGPLIAFTAIVSSFFGHYLGAQEGLNGIIVKQLKVRKKEINFKLVNIITTSFIYVSMIIVAIINPSILGFIEDLGGPIFALILFLMPIYAIYKVPSLAKFRNDKIANSFVFIMGMIAISSIVYKLISSIF